MGLTFVKMRVRRDKKAKRSVEEDFLVDSGAAITVMRGSVLRRLGVEPDEKQTFLLANGEQVTREVGEAYFEFHEKKGTSKVIFGKRGDSNLLGVLTLETFGLILDPLKRELKPMPMTLM